MSDELSALTISDFLNKLASRTPTPGGGSATGLAGALGCAQGEMVAAYSTRKDSDANVRDAVDSATSQLAKCRQLLSALITQDAVAYANMNAASRARKESAGDAATEGAYERAVFEASAIPMEMAAVAANALVALDEIKHSTNPLLCSDLSIAASLLDLAARSARKTLHANAPQLTNESQRESLCADVDRIVLHCASRLTSIEAFVEGHMQDQ